MKIDEIIETSENEVKDNSLDESFLLLKDEIEQLIQNKIFLGKYSEKRYVESLQAYRDIVIIESNEDIASSLNQVKKILKQFAHNRWIGISGDPQNEDSNDIFLWVKVNNVPVGKHWFQLNAITIEGKEISLEIQYVQPFRAPSTNKFISDNSDFPTLDMKEIFTYRNIYEGFKFCVVLLMVLFTFSVEALRFIGEYSIKLGYVIVHFMHVSTPVWLGVLQFLTKCVGGFYWLVYMMFRGTPNDPVVPRALLANQKQSEYSSPSYRSEAYRRSSGYRRSEIYGGDQSSSRFSYLDNSR